MPPSHFFLRRQTGLSLIEMAVGLVIVATLLTGLLVPMATQLEERRWRETRQLLEDAREALLTFAAVNRRLPCPASDTSNGIEAVPNALGPSNDCIFQAGFLPAVTLGMSGLDGSGSLSDPFGLVTGSGVNTNRVRYAVRYASDDSFKVGTVPNPITFSGAISGVSPPPDGRASLRDIAASSGYHTVCARARTASADTSCTGADNYPLASGTAVAVIFSLGPNGPVPSSWSVDETENTDNHLDSAAKGPLFFVSRPRDSEGSDRFDDQIVWISPSALLARMIAYGALP